ncbi:MAG: carboxymuconolactone decarboxylase family protein [Hyphomicrobiaceae bacterium]
MAPDIDPKSGMRLPLPNREDLDDAAKRSYDESARPGASLAGLQGPGGIKLYSPKTIEAGNRLNRYLRFEADYSPRTREITILATAREMDSQFEWVAHEDEALRVGVPAEVVDVIKHRRGTGGIDRKDAVIIELVRQMWQDHRVKSETFAEARSIFGATSLVELIMLSGNYAGTAALLCAVDMQLHEGKTPLLPIP